MTSSHFNLGIEANCVPLYMTELAPPAIRGSLVNFYQSWLMIGAVVGSAIIYGTSNLQNQFAYKTG
jgi:SP family sugar:H+ symporter-like MFS transporter